jgi:hypothetical protein
VSERQSASSRVFAAAAAGIVAIALLAGRSGAEPPAGAAPSPSQPRSVGGDDAPRPPAREWMRISPLYHQGVASDGRGTLFFSGPAVGLYRTDSRLRVQRSVAAGIPAGVVRRHGFNHVGDIAYAGGRLLLPLECYERVRGNTCGRAGIGVVDAGRLRWRHLRLLDGRDIAKAMWCATSPDGRLLWTSSGDDLVAYRLAAVLRPGRAPLRPVRRLPDAAPRGGVTGGAFWRGRLWLASGRRLWSVDPRTGARRVEVRTGVRGESEGVDSDATSLRWQVMPPAGSGLGELLAGGRMLTLRRSARRDPRRAAGG